MTVNALLPVSVTITPDANPVCTGATATFTATPVNGGTTPAYQWYNGVTPVGTDSPIYSYIPNNGDVITVVLTSNETCQSGGPATSNAVTVTVNPILPVSVSIAADANPVCAGTTVNFTASPVNGGTTPAYQWYKGATVVGINSPTYAYVPTNGDVITVVLTSSLTCTSTNPATSNIETMTVNSLPTVSTSHVDVSCFGSTDGSVTITGSGGISPYMYSLNGGTFQVSGTFNNLAGAAYTITVQDANLCTANVSVTIVEPAAVSIASPKVDDASCPDVADGSITLTITGGTPPYSVIWSGNILIQDRQDIPAGTYSVTVTDKNGCAAHLEDIIVGIAGSDKCIEIPTIITPNNDGVNDTWQIKNIDMFPDAEVYVFTRWGKLVFHTKNLAANPWNGTFEGTLLPTDSYHYVLHLNDGSKPRSGVISIIR
jgi:gliding motility-associated-like protein